MLSCCWALSPRQFCLLAGALRPAIAAGILGGCVCMLYFKSISDLSDWFLLIHHLMANTGSTR